MTDELEDIYEIENIVRSGDNMRVRLRSSLDPETVVELEPLPILVSTPPLENPPEIASFGITDPVITVLHPNYLTTEELHFEFSFSLRGGDNVTSILMDLGDGSEPLQLVDEDGNVISTSELRTISVADDYTATLTVDGPGGSDSATFDYSVVEPGP